MSLFDGYRQRRREISTRESVATLDHMKQFFGDGENWRQHIYQGDDGGRCLIAAADHVRVSSIDDAKHWLRRAIKEKTGQSLTIEQFNDTRRSFAEIQEVLDRARELARTGGRQLPALVGEVLPARPALPAPVASVPANPWAAPAPVGPTTALLSALRDGWAAGGTQPRRASLWDWTE